VTWRTVIEGDARSADCDYLAKPFRFRGNGLVRADPRRWGPGGALPVKTPVPAPPLTFEIGKDEAGA